MPFVTLNGAEIYYEVSGASGPWVVLIAAARFDMKDMEVLRQAFITKGFRVLSHDRRNCGRSSLDFDNPMSEEVVWQDDLLALFNEFGIRRACLVGHSRSNRVILRFALAHRSRTIGLGLWGLTGGVTSVRYLCADNYQKYISAALTSGMLGVCNVDHFKNLAAARPDAKEQLLALGVTKFVAVLERWKKQFLVTAWHPVAGVSDAELRAVRVPVLVVPIYDKIHPFAASLHASQMMPGSVLFDYGPDQHDAESRFEDQDQVAQILCEFAESLTEPLSIRINKWWRQWPKRFRSSRIE